MRNSRFRFFIIALLVASRYAQATWLSQACEALGLCDPPSSPAELVDLLLDVSPGSPASEQTTLDTLRVLLPWVAHRPSSVVGEWVLGESLATTQLVASVTSTASARLSASAVKAHEAVFVHEATSTLISAALPSFGRPMHRSPIAEGLSRLALTTAPSGSQRWIVVITDAREVSTLGGRARTDFECGPLPSPAEFLRLLHDAGLLLPGSLAGARITFCYVRPDAVAGDRCPVSLRRFSQIIVLWRAALESSGATVEVLSSGLTAF